MWLDCLLIAYTVSMIIMWGSLLGWLRMKVAEGECNVLRNISMYSIPISIFLIFLIPVTVVNIGLYPSSLFLLKPLISDSTDYLCILAALLSVTLGMTALLLFIVFVAVPAYIKKCRNT